MLSRDKAQGIVYTTSSIRIFYQFNFLGTLHTIRHIIYDRPEMMVVLRIIY